MTPRARHLAIPALLALLALVTACPGPRAPRTGASCAEARQRLAESAAARAEGHLLRALARAEDADRACASEDARRAAAELREELEGREPPAAGDAAELRAAMLLRLAGEPAQALAKLRPLAARLDAAGLAELARLAAATGHAAEAQGALEKAAARAERRAGGRGSWRWQESGRERNVLLAFAPDGAQLASADRNGWIRIWDLGDGHERASIHALGWPSSLAISPDGAWIAAAQGRGGVEVWEVATGKKILELAEAAPAAFTPEGHLVMATAKHEGLLEVELPSGKPVAHLGAGALHAFAITRDRIYAAGEDAQRNELLLTWERGGQRKLEERPLPKPVWRLEATPRGELAVLLADQLLFYAPDGTLRHTFVADTSSMALAPDGKQLLLSVEGSVELFDLGSGQLVRRIEAGADWVDLAVHPRAALLATAGADGVSIWSLASGERAARFGGPIAAVSVAFDADGGRLAVGSASGTATIWDLAGGTRAAITPRPGKPVTGVAFGPGGILATASGPPSQRLLGRTNRLYSEGTLAVWDAGLARRWSKDLGSLHWIGFRPGSDTLASASQGGLMLWDGAGAPQQVLQPATGGGGYAWSPDGARLASSDYNGTTLSPADGRRGTPLEASAEVIAFQPAGGVLAASDKEGRLSLWDTATGQPQRVLLESKPAAALAWAPDGGVLAAATGRSIALWDPGTGARKATLSAHAALTALAFRPDGHLLAAACDDGQVELWSVADATLVATLAMAGEASGIVLAPDGAIGGTIADGDPLFWVAGGATLPARAVWDREAVPGLLQARLAKVAAEAAPRAGLPGAAPPPTAPACLTAPAGPAQRKLVAASAPDDRSLSLCVGIEPAPDEAPRLPTCFLLDLASGAFHPRLPTPRELLGRDEPPAATAEVDGAQVTVCRAGACRELTIPELPPGENAREEAAVSDDGRLVAVLAGQGDLERRSKRSGLAVVYDVSIGRRIQRINIGSGFASLGFVGDTLLVTKTPCAGPCSSSVLVDPRTGTPLGAVGGGFNTSGLAPVHVTGTVWAFNDANLEGKHALIAFQDIKTGRIVHRFELPRPCGDDGDGDCGTRMIHGGNGVALIDEGHDAGDLTLLDARGAIVARHRVPICKP